LPTRISILLRNLRSISGIDRNGFFAEYIAISPKYLVPIPDSVTDEEAAIMEPVALAIHVLDLLQPKLGDWATVVGRVQLVC